MLVCVLATVHIQLVLARTPPPPPIPQDASLRHTLQFGIGLHHAGLNDGDRQLVERLYVENKIQVRGGIFLLKFFQCGGGDGACGCRGGGVTGGAAGLQVSRSHNLAKR